MSSEKSVSQRAFPALISCLIDDKHVVYICFCRPRFCNESIFLRSRLRVKRGTSLIFLNLILSSFALLGRECYRGRETEGTRLAAISNLFREFLHEIRKIIACDDFEEKQCLACCSSLCSLEWTTFQWYSLSGDISSSLPNAIGKRPAVFRRAKLRDDSERLSRPLVFEQGARPQTQLIITLPFPLNLKTKRVFPFHTSCTTKQIHSFWDACQNKNKRDPLGLPTPRNPVTKNTHS